MAEPIRVLLVDDQSLVRSGFRMLIDSEDDMAVVGEASNGAEARSRHRAAAATLVAVERSIRWTASLLNDRAYSGAGRVLMGRSFLLMAGSSFDARPGPLLLSPWIPHDSAQAKRNTVS